MPARRAPIFSATHPISTSTSIAIAPALYGVSTTKLESLLRAAYSQNYVYLIKQADDQYQVIVEAEDKARAGPEDFRQIYVKPDNGQQQAYPVRAADQHRRKRLGLQSVNHINQFTSVTFGFDTKPGVALGDVTNLHRQNRREQFCPPTVKGELQGEGLVLQQLFSGAAVSRHRGGLRHVCDPRHSLRELCPSRHGALDAFPGGRRRIDDALALRLHRSRSTPSSGSSSSWAS